MSRRIQENALSILLLGLFVAVILAGQGYGPRARFVPTIVAYIGVLLVLGQLLLFNLRQGASVKVDLLEVISARATGDDEALPENLRGDMDAALGKNSENFEETERKRPLLELKALSIVLLGVVMFAVIGPIATMFIYTFGYFVISGHCKIWRAAIYSSVFTALVYGLFVLWLRVDISVGILEWNFNLW
jgi:hypothetical protein